jgi:hypothetical protein
MLKQKLRKKQRQEKVVCESKQEKKPIKSGLIEKSKAGIQMSKSHSYVTKTILLCELQEEVARIAHRQTKTILNSRHLRFMLLPHLPGRKMGSLQKEVRRISQQILLFCANQSALTLILLILIKIIIILPVVERLTKILSLHLKE